MSFDPTWLDLREPADHAARAQDLLEAFCARMPKDARILDLGSGTGSTMRAISPLLPDASWTLTDYDPTLLAFAKQHAPEAEVMHVDLAKDLAGVLVREADAITASALIDLVSAEWLDLLTAHANGRTIYIALSYDGHEEWSPAHSHDQTIFEAFQNHQRGDKGFGPAMGAAAVPHLLTALKSAGYEVRISVSPWKLKSGTLMQTLAQGIAHAAREAGVSPEIVDEWSTARADSTSCRVGHLDLLAFKTANFFDIR